MPLQTDDRRGIQRIVPRITFDQHIQIARPPPRAEHQFVRHDLLGHEHVAVDAAGLGEHRLGLLGGEADDLLPLQRHRTARGLDRLDRVVAHEAGHGDVLDRHRLQVMVVVREPPVLAEVHQPVGAPAVTAVAGVLGRQFQGENAGADRRVVPAARTVGGHGPVGRDLLQQPIEQPARLRVAEDLGAAQQLRGPHDVPETAVEVAGVVDAHVAEIPPVGPHGVGVGPPLHRVGLVGVERRGHRVVEPLTLAAVVRAPPQAVARLPGALVLAQGQEQVAGPGPVVESQEVSLAQLAEVEAHQSHALHREHALLLGDRGVHPIGIVTQGLLDPLAEPWVPLQRKHRGGRQGVTRPVLPPVGPRLEPLGERTDEIDVVLSRHRPPRHRERRRIAGLIPIGRRLGRFGGKKRHASQESGEDERNEP